MACHEPPCTVDSSVRTVCVYAVLLVWLLYAWCYTRNPRFRMFITCVWCGAFTIVRDCVLELLLCLPPVGDHSILHPRLIASVRVL